MMRHKNKVCILLAIFRVNILERESRHLEGYFTMATVSGACAAVAGVQLPTMGML